MSTKQKLPKRKSSIRQDRFVWESPDGVIIDLPAMSTLSLKQIKALQNRKDAGAITGMADTPEAADSMEDLPLYQLGALIKAWTRDVGDDLMGKSEASSAS